MTDGARCLKKTLAARIWRGQNRVQNYIFCHFLKFGSLVVLEIAYSDSLQQCITSSKDKTYEKKFGGGGGGGPYFCQNGPKSGPKLGFLLFTQGFFISFPLNCIG